MFTEDMTSEEKVQAGLGLFQQLAKADELQGLRILEELDSLIEDMTFDRVHEVRENWNPPASWSAIGEAIGVSRQTAWDRWSKWFDNPDAPPSRRPRPRTPSSPDSSTSGPQWWKMNLRGDHIDGCEQALVFGTNKMPTGMRPGDVLLLQANVSSRPDPNARIRTALIYETVRPSLPGEGRAIWGQDFKYMIVASECVPTKPFSLELLDITDIYRRQGQMANQRILPEDLPAVRDASGLTDR